ALVHLLRSEPVPVPPPVEAPAARPAAAPAEGAPSAADAPAGGDTDAMRSAIRQNAEAIARLEQRLAELAQSEVGGGAKPAVAKAELLARVRGLEHGEQQLAILQALADLVALGDAVVPDLVDLLSSGFDRDYGGGFSMGGNKMNSYPRLRTMLIDALRQIGTDAAKEGLLRALGSSGSLTDYRDLLMLFKSTTDEGMIRGISARLPDLFAKLEEADLKVLEREARSLDWQLAAWLQGHPSPQVVEMVAGLLERGKIDSRSFGAELLGVLVDSAPERAFAALVKLATASGGESAIRETVHPMAFRNTKLARAAQFLELVLGRMNPSTELRMHLYANLPLGLCRAIEDPGARAADGRQLLELLTRQLAVETDPKARARLQWGADRLKKEIERVEGR
ncbi:MAG: hypothetical protein JXQ29_12085, partial [Planctomycetes bacterium]|nr:hypothetical protein [Planctomycetota bacterium]